MPSQTAVRGRQFPPPAKRRNPTANRRGRQPTASRSRERSCSSTESFAPTRSRSSRAASTLRNNARSKRLHTPLGQVATPSSQTSVQRSSRRPLANPPQSAASRGGRAQTSTRSARRPLVERVTNSRKRKHDEQYQKELDTMLDKDDDEDDELLSAFSYDHVPISEHALRKLAVPIVIRVRDVTPPPSFRNAGSAWKKSAVQREPTSPITVHSLSSSPVASPASSSSYATPDSERRSQNPRRRRRRVSSPAQDELKKAEKNPATVVIELDDDDDESPDPPNTSSENSPPSDPSPAPVGDVILVPPRSEAPIPPRPIEVAQVAQPNEPQDVPMEEDPSPPSRRSPRVSLEKSAQPNAQNPAASMASDATSSGPSTSLPVNQQRQGEQQQQQRVVRFEEDTPSTASPSTVSRPPPAQLFEALTTAIHKSPTRRRSKEGEKGTNVEDDNSRDVPSTSSEVSTNSAATEISISAAAASAKKASPATVIERLLARQQRQDARKESPVPLRNPDVVGAQPPQQQQQQQVRQRLNSGRAVHNKVTLPHAPSPVQRSTTPVMRNTSNLAGGLLLSNGEAAKSQRLADEKNKLSIAWSFKTPTDEHVQHLKRLFSQRAAQVLVTHLFSSDHQHHKQACERITAMLGSHPLLIIAHSDLFLKWATLQFSNPHYPDLIKVLHTMEGLLHKYHDCSNESANRPRASASAREGLVRKMTDTELASFLPFVIAKYSDDSASVRVSVQMIVGTLIEMTSIERVMPYLYKAAESPNTRLRAETIALIGKLIPTLDPETIQELGLAKRCAKCMEDADKWVRGSGVKALMEIYKIIGEDLFKHTGILSSKQQTLLNSGLQPIRQARELEKTRSLLAVERDANARAQTDMAALIAAHEAEKAKWKEERGQLAAERLSAVEEADRIRAENARLVEEKSTLRNDLSDLRVDYARIRAEREELRADLTNQQSSKSKPTRPAVALAESLEAGTPPEPVGRPSSSQHPAPHPGGCAELSAELQEFQRELNERFAQFESRSNENSVMAASDDGHIDESGSTPPPSQDERARLEAQIQQLKAQIEELRAQLDQKKELVTQKDSIIAKLETALAAKQRLVADLELQARQKRRSLERLHGQLQEVNRQLECTLCKTNRIQVAYRDCGHMACQSCADQWMHQTTDCPVCRQKTNGTLRVFT